jgi:AcrR family transcriptional regulator
MSPRPSIANERRPQILAAACRAIAERGFGQTRLQDVAAAAGLGVGVVQHYFPSRHELLMAAFRFANERSILNWTGRPAVTGADPWRRLELLIEASTTDDPAWREMWGVWLEIFRVARHDEELRRSTAEVYQRWRGPLLEPMSEGVRLGLFHPTEPLDDVVDGLIALCDGLDLQRQLSPERMPAERMRRILLTQLTVSLGCQGRVPAAAAG